MLEFLAISLPATHTRTVNYQISQDQVARFTENLKKGISPTGSFVSKKSDASATVEKGLLEIHFVNMANNRVERLGMIWTDPIKVMFRRYSEILGTHLKQLRFIYNGKTLYLSKVGKKTPMQMGFKQLDEIYVEVIQEPQSKGKSKKEKASRSSRPPKEYGKNKDGKTKNKKTSTCSSQTFNFEDSDVDKIQHSTVLSTLFEEADSRFKEIRQTLNAMCLDRMQPKDKTSLTKKSSIAPLSTINNPSMDGLGGKAGKTSFVVQVGEVANLYKTSKRSTANASSSSKPIMIDLHGYTKQEALNKLGESLPEWTDIAMRGPYPFVQPVVIVCGGGNQILSECVENWIRSNDNVSNAPKNLIPRGELCFVPVASGC